MENKNNLVSLATLKRKLNEKNLSHLITDIDYSKQKYKKYRVTLKNGKPVNFGDKRYEDFIIHKDKERQKKYRNRHRSDKINDPNFPGFWSYHLLW